MSGIPALLTISNGMVVAVPFPNRSPLHEPGPDTSPSEPARAETLWPPRLDFTVTLPGSPAGFALSNTTLCGRADVATVVAEFAASTDTSVNVLPGPVVMSIVNGTPNNGNVTVVGASTAAAV